MELSCTLDLFCREGTHELVHDIRFRPLACLAVIKTHPPQTSRTIGCHFLSHVCSVLNTLVHVLACIDSSKLSIEIWNAELCKTFVNTKCQIINFLLA